MADVTQSKPQSLWIQVVGGGISMLIPARKYPAWLRHSLTWGSTVGIFTLMAVPGAVSKLQELTPGQAGSDQPVPEDVEVELADVRSASGQDTDVRRADTGTVDASSADIEKIDSNPVVRIGVAAAVGACTYSLWRFSFWLDGATERGLRKLRVPYPRVVMGVAVGGLYWATEKFERHMDARAPQSKQPDAR